MGVPGDGISADPALAIDLGVVVLGLTDDTVSKMTEQLHKSEIIFQMAT